MTRRQIAEWLVLGAIWGASFLFMRLGASAFGPVGLAFMRVAGASALLAPLMLTAPRRRALAQHWRAIAVVGLFNSVLPFLFYAVAALALTTGLMSIVNATVPIWGALVARVWLGDRLTPLRTLGLAIGVAGVAALTWDKADLRPGAHGVSTALGIAACIGATAMYGLGANLPRRLLTGAPPMVVAAGSLLASVVMLGPLATLTWPSTPPGATAWSAALALALLCTGLAYVLYFRLLASAGAANAVSVTFTVPVFAMLWGWLFLDEVPGATTLAASAVILLGTALATGMIGGRP